MSAQAALRRGAAALGVGVAGAVAVAGGSLARLNTEVLGYYNDDSAGALYLHDSFHRALMEGRALGVDPNQLYPVGLPLRLLHGGNGLEMVLSGFFALFVDAPAWYSWSALAWIPLNVLAFLPLGRHLWARTGPALAAGLGWAIFPPMLGEMAAGRLTQVATVGLPLAVLGLLRLTERARAQDRWLAGAGLAMTGLGYWFYGIFLSLLTPIFLLLGGRDRGRTARDLGVVGLIAGALSLPFAWPVLAARLGGGWSGSPPLDARTLSPVFDNALRLVGEQPRQLTGWLPWLWIPGILWTALRGQRRGLWLGLAGICVVFALGPGAEIGGHTWILPYWPVWRFVPLLDRLTHPGRWLLVGGLFLAIAAADGLARRRPWLVWSLPLGALAQGWWTGALPMPSFPVTPPAVWQALAAREGGAVIVLPVLADPLSCRWQPLHRRPLLGGMVEDKPWAWPPEYRAFVEGNATLMGLWAYSRGSAHQVSLYQRDLDALRQAGFDTIVLDREAWRGDDSALSALGDPLWTDDSGSIWALPAVGLPGDPPRGPWRLPDP